MNIPTEYNRPLISICNTAEMIFQGFCQWSLHSTQISRTRTGSSYVRSTLEAPGSVINSTKAKIKENYKETLLNRPEGFRSDIIFKAYRKRNCRAEIISISLLLLKEFIKKLLDFNKRSFCRETLKIM